MSGPLAEYVTAFVDGVGAQLSALSGRDHGPECAVEADDLVSAIFDADGRLTRAELEAWLDDIGTRLEPPVLISSWEGTRSIAAEAWASLSASS